MPTLGVLQITLEGSRNQNLMGGGTQCKVGLMEDKLKKEVKYSGILY